MDTLSQAFYLHGIGYEFTKYTGEYVVFAPEVRRKALSCFGINCDDLDDLAVRNFQLDIDPWTKLVGAVTLVTAPDNLLHVRVASQLVSKPLTITISVLDYQAEFDLATAKETGNYRFEDSYFLELAVALPVLPAGYYPAKLQLGDIVTETELWCVPATCYQPKQLGRVAGLSLQLYTLRSDRNLGIGDYYDLRDCIEHAAKAGLQYVLLNPLHLLFVDEPEIASPYSPEHRCWQNPLYIALEGAIALLPDTQQAIFNAQLSEAQRASHKAEQFIEYSQVSTTKLAMLKAIFRCFVEQGESEPFTRFKHDNTKLLQELKTTDTDFTAFLQWLCEQQLNECQQAAKAFGMSIGLVNDLAVGCGEKSAEYQTNKSLFAQGAHVGAPPDPWAEAGQDWGLPALNPQQLAAHNFAYYRQLIKANMQSVGALRIDHVMALRRLWWCFTLEDGQKSGCYVYYPFEQLLAILKIESHQHRNMVIGEDLGVVPPEVKSALRASGIFSNILFYFEKDHDGRFLGHEHYRDDALLMIANHDVPPFVGWWQQQDIDIRHTYGLISTEKAASLRAERDTEKAKLIDWLKAYGRDDVALDSAATTVYVSLLQTLAASQSKLLTIQLDDLDGATIPVNIPGTDKEFPNWRRRLNGTVADIFSRNQHLLANVMQLRKGHA